MLGGEKRKAARYTPVSLRTPFAVLAVLLLFYTTHMTRRATEATTELLRAEVRTHAGSSITGAFARGGMTRTSSSGHHPIA